MPLALAGDNFYFEQLAADARPRKAGADARCSLKADVVLKVNYLAQIFMQVFSRYFCRFGFAVDNAVRRFAADSGNFAFKVTHTGFARIAADNQAQRVLGYRQRFGT